MPKRPGKPEAGRRSERPVSLRRAKYCPNGGMAFATITTNRRSTESRRGGQTKGHERRSWPLSRTPKTGRFAGKNGQGIPRSSPFGGSHALVWLLQTAPSTATTGAWPFAHHHGGTNREGVPAKRGSAIGIVAPVVAPRKRPFYRGKGLGPSFTQDSSLIDRLTPRARPRERRPTYLCPTQPPTPAQPS